METTSIRRKITGHTLLAFAFNTVIIALLIAILFARTAARTWGEVLDRRRHAHQHE